MFNGLFSEPINAFLHSMLKYPLALILCVLFCFSIEQDPFFWDSVQLGSKHAHFFYENGLQFLPLPELIDSGHPPFFGYYLACAWTLFGKTLIVSHWAMLPFLWLSVCLLFQIGAQLGQSQWAYYLVPIVLLDPVVLGQHLMISPDVWIICWFLMAVYGVISQQKYLVVLGILGLCLTSMRGMMTAGALCLPVLWMSVQHKSYRSIFVAFFPGFAAGLGFLGWHWVQTGWIGFHENSPWATAFQAADLGGMIKNIAVIGWRWLDFGRVFEWLLIGGIIWRLGFRVKDKKKENSYLFPALACLVIFLSYSAIRYQNLSAHRYFLPIFLMFHLWVFERIANLNVSVKARQYLFIALIIGLGTGNLWRYPTGIAMGWDSTAAHLPYHRLRAEGVAYLNAQNADFQYIGSAFPNINTEEDLHLNGDSKSFVLKDFKRNQYMFVSNVFNDFSAAEIYLLRKEWILVFRNEHAGVWVEIFKRKNIE